MIGVPEALPQRLLKTCREENISVVMISQASSEHSPFVSAIQEKQAKDVKIIVEKAFFSRASSWANPGKNVTRNCRSRLQSATIWLKAFGSRSIFLKALAWISVMAIAQGSSEMKDFHCSQEQ